jgi:TolB-like protein/DNA-binding winged helix-turn-helix (wHTH) protein/Flp pilus assembly protein TadD
MDALAPADMLLFEGFRLDRRLGCLLKQDEDGSYRPVALGSRALDVLAILLDRQGALLSKDEIMAAAWPGTVVEDNNLAVQISALRRILDRDRAEGSCIQTIPGRGYRFIAPVIRTNSAVPPLALPPSGNGVDEHTAADEQLQSRLGIPAHRDKPSTQASRRRPGRGILAGVIGALLLIVAGLAAWHLRSPGSDEGRRAPRLSIVVLPFADLGDDPKQQYFADGITEDLTTDLSRIADMLVISHNTAFTYKDKPVNAKQIGRELGVRYVLEGSVEHFGNRVRTNAQLIDAETNMHLWAERFDHDAGDFFALQDEITRWLAAALNANLIRAEASHSTDNPDALDYILRGRAAENDGWTRDNYARAIDFFERALALDPRSVEARTLLANLLVSRVLRQQTDTAGADTARADELVEQALAASPNNASAHYVKGNILRIQGRCPEAIPEFERAIAADRNFAAAYGNLGWCKFLTGSIDEMIPLAEQAIRLSPRDPFVGTLYDRIGHARLLQSRPDEAIGWFKRALIARPIGRLKIVHLFLASAYALQGETELATSELAQARRFFKPDTFNITWVRTQMMYRPEPGPPPAIRALDDRTLFAGLRKAGMPEQ